MTAREDVVAQLAQLDDDDIMVRAYARLSRQPAKLTLMVRFDEVETVAGAEANARKYSFSLILLGTKSVTEDDSKGGVDDELDDALEFVLAQLDKGITDLIWTSAKRGTYEATNSPCFIIATELHGTYEGE